MNKKIIFSLIFAVIVFIALGFIFLKPKSEKPAEVLNNDATTNLGESTSTNPMNNKPDINPVNKSNPFSSIKTNPFK